MRDGNTCRRVGTFVAAAAATWHLVVRVAWHTRHGSRTVAIVAVVVALPVSAQADQGTTNVIGMLLALILVVGGPALVGVGADWAIRLCSAARDAAIPYRVAVPSVRARWADQFTKFPKANITTIAVPLIDECKPKGGKICLIGGDGSYFTGDNKQKLQDALQRWIVHDGIEVQYMLVQPAPGVPEAMQVFSEEVLGEERVKLKVFVRDDRVGMPADIQRLADLLTTYHPNLISWSNSQGMARAMWLEGRHPPHEDISYDNRWVPPSSMSDSVSRGVGRAMTWKDVFVRWERAFGELRPFMIAQ